LLTQRPRLRGPQASIDFFAGVLSYHPLQKADPRRSHIAPDPCAILSRSRGGTDGLNPLPSSGESDANLISGQRRDNGAANVFEGGNTAAAGTTGEA
jgi:hypothetical protein